jgi:D-alanyl-D-alanine carboxypeptidase/D-alanyl-D-alanine-endopeptidase (penicillin-binding protein 4)
MRNWIAILCFTIGCFSCSPISKKSLNKIFRDTDSKFQDHTGFALYDLDKKKSLYEYQAGQYFTPASNTKIFTFFTCLALLGDSVPGLRYVEHQDSLIFWGTGDPSFLYKEVYDNNRVFSFLKSASPQLYFSDGNFQTTNFGPGWAWDDYNDYYSAERSPFPIYGNILTLEACQKNALVAPAYLKNYVKIGAEEKKPKVIRRLESNEFIYHPSPFQAHFKADVPFKVTPELAVNLLSDTLKRMVRLIQKPFVPFAQTLYSLPVDSVYKVMMQESDNFIAEQLLLICSQAISDTLQPEIAIRYAKKNLLKDLADEPRWVDGSGLSRYNLFTPRSIVQLWGKIYERMPRQRLFAVLATGGRYGTIKNWYNADVPYIFGKTGSLSNNHCLSGYLITKKGKTLIFSFMNNNFTASTNEIRQNMENILRSIYEKY